jgi:DNA repair exonuclease SbcCD ATPase subunit
VRGNRTGQDDDSTEIDALQAALTTTKSDKNRLEKQISELEARLGETEAKSESDKLDCDRQLREIQTRHRREIDELTAELDLFEAENVENIRKLQESLKDKEAVISAMGSQLAEAESRFASTIENQHLLQCKIKELQEDLRKANDEKAAKEQEVTEQIVLKEKAIEDVANELTAKAEKQFEERNELYRVLKKKFDEATSKISILERDTRFAKKELDELKKRHEAREADLKDELAQAKAAIAKSEAILARAEKNHRAELQLSKEDLDAAKATSEQIQKSLALVVHEKEKLAAEVVDLKNISEELMAMVEERGLA